MHGDLKIATRKNHENTANRYFSHSGLDPYVDVLLSDDTSMCFSELQSNL